MTGRYTHGHESATLASHGARTARTSAAYLLPHLRAGMSLLDVGCGPGTITLDLAEVVAPGVVTGLEPVEPPLTTARQNAAARGDESTRWVIGSVYELPFDDDQFDVVHAHQVLQHLTDPVAALVEMARVCRPGGLLAVRDADYASMAWYPLLPGIQLWLDTYRTIARGNGAEPDAGRRLRAWVNAAGLTDVTLSTSTWTYDTADACRWWGMSQGDRVGGEAFREQAAQHGVSAAEVDAMVADWRAWAEHPDAWFSMTHAEAIARIG